jgi:hypothetical protein
MGVVAAIAFFWPNRPNPAIETTVFQGVVIETRTMQKMPRGSDLNRGDWHE